jgi:hypothetical protein
MAYGVKRWARRRRAPVEPDLHPTTGHSRKPIKPRSFSISTLVKFAPIELLPIEDRAMKRILGVTTALALGCTVAFANTTAKPGITPVQAELIADVNSRLLTAGNTVYARVIADWQGADCELRSGAILEAQVISVVPHTKTVKGSELDLAFTKAQCGEPKIGAFGLLLVAMAAPPQNSDMGIISSSLPTRTGGAGGIQALKNSSMTTITLEAQFPQFPFRPSMQMGDVIGIRKLKLSVGTGPGNSSVLTSMDHDVSLDKHTLLLLVPSQGTFPRMPTNPVAAHAAASNGSAVHAASPPETVVVAPLQPPLDDIDLCVPPECNMAMPPGNAIENDRPLASISIRQLGYAPRAQRRMSSFDNDEAMAYLGPRELLVAFNPHKLAQRHALGKAGFTVRWIRAVLLNTETHQLMHTVDWELPDDRQYLWPLADNRVLVHVGSELRVYGAGLKILDRIPLDGPLAFVRVTPDANFMAVGVIRERHSPELHAELSRNLGSDPEEDVNILVLNSNFEVIASSSARSDFMAPTLLNEGQARLLALPNMRYRISMLTWDNHPSTVARLTSSCVPELTSLAPDFIFLVSCDKQSKAREYRVLHADGKMALKGGAMLNECGHAAESSANREAFVVKVVQSSLPMPPEQPFSATDFSSEDLRVYRASDSKRLLSVRVGSPSSSRDGYALAPDGSQLAVLTRDQIEVFSVPDK